MLSPSEIYGNREAVCHTTNAFSGANKINSEGVGHLINAYWPLLKKIMLGIICLFQMEIP